MRLKKYGLLSLLFFLTGFCFAQKQVVFEKLRCFDINHTLTGYLQTASIKKNIASQLNTICSRQLQLPIPDTSDFSVDFIDFYHIPDAIKIDIRDTDTNHLHLYMNFFEIQPYYFYRNNPDYSEDSNLVKRTKTVFLIEYWLVRADKSVYRNGSLNIVVSESRSPGIGTLYNNGLRFGEMAVLPTTFTGLFKASAEILFQPDKKMNLVEIKLLPAFLADNYILPKTIGWNRTYVETNQHISSYAFQNNHEIIRQEEPFYEQIILKGKNAKKYPAGIVAAIENTDHYSRSDYVFLEQNWRDVIRDKNYQVKLTVQVDPMDVPQEQSLIFTNFIQGDFHYLLQDKDTLATFGILKKVTEPGRKYFNSLSNGYDSSTLFPINGKPAETPVINDYEISGHIKQLPFTIKCSGKGNQIKEIYLNKELVCIAQGKFIPEKFVVFDASLSPEMLNPLLMIGFNRFFE
jgi:hypothetical protein